MPEPRLIFTTEDEGRANDALGKTFMMGAVPYEATDVVAVDRRVWEVRGVAREPHR